MSERKLIILDLILVLLIIILIICHVGFEKYTTSPYNPFNDAREYNSDINERIEDKDIPKEVLNNSNEIITEYKNKLNYNNKEFLVPHKIESTLKNGDSMYLLKYIVTDTKANKNTIEINLWLEKDGSLKRIRADYRNMELEEFIENNKMLIELKSLNLSRSLIDKINQNSQTTPDSSWNIGTDYNYEFISRENDDNSYARFEKLRIVFINF